MKTVNNTESNLKTKLLKLFNVQDLNYIPIIIGIVFYIITALIAVNNKNSESMNNIREFEIGKVAERDVIAGFSASYVDIEATRIRAEAQEKAVPAVFRYSETVNTDINNSWKNFCDESSGDYFPAGERENFRNFGNEILEIILKEGIYSIHQEEIKNYNPEILERLAYMADLVRYSLIVIATIPIVVVYPFIQRYFIKGVMIGSFKG
jgi:hypothetical protein